MTRNVLALTALLAFASFVSPTQAGFLCEDDDGEVEICLKRIPYTSVLPRGIPGIPGVVAVERDDDDVVVVAPRMLPRATGADVSVIDVPAARIPEVAQACRKYVPNLGEMLPIPCDD